MRELVSSIVSRTAPILLDRDEAILALDLSPATFDRRIRDGKLALENAAAVGGRELYRREQIRPLILTHKPSAETGSDTKIANAGFDTSFAGV